MYDFIAAIFELGGMAEFQDFSPIMYDERLYTLPFWTLVFAPVITLIFYYKVFDSVSGASIGRWLLYGLGSSLIVFLVNLFYLNSQNDRRQLDFIFADLLTFLTIAFSLSLVLYILLSFAFRYLSTHRRYVPV
jgi:hypothetical protein